jgi:hypothetical protein
MILKILSLFFLLNNLYYIFNYKRLDEPFKMRDENKKLDLLHYILKVLYLVWLCILVFIQQSLLIWILISIITLRIPVYYTNKRSSIVYHRLVPILNIIILILYLFS